MPKIVFYTADDPDAQHATYAHLALILYDDGAPWPIRITGRSKEVVQSAAEQTIAEELARAEKKAARPARVTPRRRREEGEPLPPVHAGYVPDQVAHAMDLLDMLDEEDGEVIEVIEAPELQPEADEVI